MYTNQTLISAFLKRSIKDKELAILPFLIASVDAFIDYQIGSSFAVKLNDASIAEVAETTRIYDGGDAVVNIDPAISITSVESTNNLITTDTEYTDDDYLAYPLNSSVKTWLRINTGIFPKGTGNIRVTAKFTSGDVPKDIQYLSTYLAAQMLSKAVAGDLAKESIEGYSREYKKFDVESLQSDGVVSMILDKYRNNNILLASV